MDFFLIPAVILVLAGGKIFPPGKTDPEPFAISKTRAVCGLCTLLVFYRHMGQYLDLDGAHDQIFAAVDSFLRQAILFGLRDHGADPAERAGVRPQHPAEAGP